MRILDEKFKKNPFQYFIQFGLVTISVFIILLFLHTLSSATIVASLGASSFIAFTAPHAQSSRPRFLIGGYVVGVLSGLLCNGIQSWFIPSDFTFLGYPSYTFFCAVAVGLAMFTMAITNFEHPPAAALALGLVVDKASLKSVMVALVGIIALSAFKTLLKPYMKNLL